MLEWILSFLSAQVIPVTVLAAGYYYKNRVPKTMKTGYRTARSTRSRESWVFAHRMLGRLWRPLGWVLLTVSFFGMFAVLIINKDALEKATSVLAIAQTVVMVGSLIPVERALKQNFDENGYPNDAETWAQCREEDETDEPKE
ncbi:MAG: SdpI family protein [Clostridia bacterium]|nr:SdpI family protein [Clostridia bacterium]